MKNKTLMAVVAIFATAGLLTACSISDDTPPLPKQESNNQSSASQEVGEGETKSSVDAKTVEALNYSSRIHAMLDGKGYVCDDQKKILDDSTMSFIEKNNNALSLKKDLRLIQARYTEVHYKLSQSEDAFCVSQMISTMADQQLALLVPQELETLSMEEHEVRKSRIKLFVDTFEPTYKKNNRIAMATKDRMDQNELASEFQSSQSRAEQKALVIKPLLQSLGQKVEGKCQVVSNQHADRLVCDGPYKTAHSVHEIVSNHLVLVEEQMASLDIGSPHENLESLSKKVSNANDIESDLEAYYQMVLIGHRLLRKALEREAATSPIN